MLSECFDLISALGSQTCELYLSLYTSSICMVYLLFRISFLVFAFAVNVVVVVDVAQPRG